MEYVASFILGLLSSLAASWIIKRLASHYAHRLSFSAILDNINIIRKQLDEEDFVPDFIIAIDRNASIIGSILAGLISVRSVQNILTETNRNPDGSRSMEIIKEASPRADIYRNKNILIMTCFNESGQTLKLVHDYISSVQYPPQKIRTAALFTSASPLFKPHFYAKEVGSTIKTPMIVLMKSMPWMIRGWRHILPKERQSFEEQG